jgi:hypothetical protein
MFDQESLENHFRLLAQKHEEAYNPDDWADMQARLQNIGLTQVRKSPLQGVLRRSSILVALMLLVGMKVWYDAPLPATGKDSVRYISKKQPYEIPQQANILPENTAQNFSTNPPAFKQNTIIANKTINTFQQKSVLPIWVGKTTQNIATISENLPTGIDNKEEVLPTELLTPADILQPIGLATTEPFMQKGITDLPPIETKEIDKEKPKTGYQHVEMYASEGFHSNLAFKIGTGRAYSIFNIGYQFSSGGRWGVGYGFGKELRKKERSSINLEFLGHYIKENTSSNQLNLLGQAKIQFNKRFTSKITGFAGLSGNLLVTDYRGEDLATGSGLPSWAVIRTNIDATNIRIWTGLNLGVSIRVK